MIIIIAVGAVFLIGGGAILWWLYAVASAGSRAAATASGLPTPPEYSYSPPPLPTYTPYSPPDGNSPTDGASPPDAYSPPPQHFGAIAVASDGSYGRAWDYDTVGIAERKALTECPRSGCKVLVTFVNGCGAIAYNPNTNRYWGGKGDTRGEAESNAVSNAGGGHWITYVCTTR